MQRLRTGLLLPALSVVTLLSAIGLHEFGHAVAIYGTGGRILEISLVDSVPHILATRAISPAVEAIRIAAGSGLTIALTFVVLAVLGLRHSIVTETLGLFALVEITGWFASALHFGDTQNDAADFIACTGIPGYYVAAICALAALAGVTMIASRLRWGAQPVKVPTCGAATAR